MDLQALRAELDAGHPFTGPYSSDNVLACDQLNAANRSVWKKSVATGDVASVITKADHLGLSNADRGYLQLIMIPQVLLVSATLRQELGDLFPAGSQTRAALAAILRQPGSRCSELGLGICTPSHVADARRL